MPIDWGQVIGTAIGSAIQGAANVGSTYIQSEDQKRIARQQAKLEEERMAQQAAELEQQRRDAMIKQPASRGGGSSFAFDPGPSAMASAPVEPFGVIAGQLIDTNPRQNPFLA